MSPSCIDIVAPGAGRVRHPLRPLGAIAIGLCLIGAAAPPGPRDTTVRKTLAECTAIALDSHPTLTAAGATTDAARERVWQNAALYLPQVTGNGSIQRQRVSSTNLTSVTSGVAGASGRTTRARTFTFSQDGFSLTQILFDFGQNLSRIHAAEALARSAAADADTQRDAVIFGVAQSYYGLLASYHLRDVADETVAQNTKHLELAQGRFDVGLAPRFDVTQAQVQLASAELNRVTARNNVALGRETLRNALGIDGPLDFDPVDVLDRPPAPLDDAAVVEAALAHRPELRSIAEREAAQQAQISAIEKDYLPKVTGNAGYTWSGRTSPFGEGWDVGAAVTVPVFNGGLTGAQVGEARANLANLQASDRALRQNIELEVRQAALDVHQDIDAVRVARKGVQQGHENVELAEGRYATGVGTIIEVTDAQASLATAEANLVQAQAGYWTALATLERATAASLGND